MSTVYICHHVDTEGPLWESMEELFERLRIIFGINLDPTYANLELLQKGKIEIEEAKKKELISVVDPHSIGFKSDWGMIKEMLLRIMDSSYRNLVLDSFGGGWIYNWHVMDHVGFGPSNPRHRDYGYHNIFDFYKKMIFQTNSEQDAIHWHFHPIPFYKQANIPATSYDNSMDTLHQIICRRLIDKNWFPVVNRAGFHSERIDSNLFLEQWIPFDPSNQAVEEDSQPKYQKDLSSGRFGDWRGAPTDWSTYHPNIYDWKQKGQANRVIARALNMKSRHRRITTLEIEKAFGRAQGGEDIYLGITNHDWREMSNEINEFREMLQDVLTRYPTVNYKFSESVDAFRQVLGYSEEQINENKLELKAEIKDNILKVIVAKGEIFGPQPYLAIKTLGGDYFHDNFDFHEFKKLFSYTFDNNTIPLSIIDTIAIASNDKYGSTTILSIPINY